MVPRNWRPSRLWTELEVRGTISDEPTLNAFSQGDIDGVSAATTGAQKEQAVTEKGVLDVRAYNREAWD
ncbi:MAG: hypothetical protein PVH41_18920, partial [Anaerolineae bacterium]